MVKCCAYQCDSASYHKTPGLTFHRFPKDESLRNVWIENMKLQDWQPRPSSVLCSKHFEKHFLDPSAFRTTLRPGAIPTLFYELPVTPYEMENVINPPQKTLPRKRTADMENVSVHKEIQNKIKPVVSTSHITETSLIVQDDENVPGPSNYNIVTPSVPPVPVSTRCEEVQRLKRKINLKNKKIKALLQQRKRLRNKVSRFSDIITELKKELSQDDIHILTNIPGNNKDFIVRYIKKGKGCSIEKSYLN